jgi:hypothetical protein
MNRLLSQVCGVGGKEKSIVIILIFRKLVAELVRLMLGVTGLTHTSSTLSARPALPTAESWGTPAKKSSAERRAKRKV